MTFDQPKWREPVVSTIKHGGLMGFEWDFNGDEFPLWCPQTGKSPNWQGL
jgi:hypothetical protein